MICPVVARVVMGFCPEPPEPRPFWSLGSITGMLVCPLVALRTGRLRDLLLSTLVGALAGYFDLQAMLWLYRSAGWSVIAASLVPVWGGCIGGWVALGQQFRLRSVLTLGAIIVADIAARLAWRWLYESETANPVIADWGSLLECLVYSPTAMLAVILARRAPSPDHSARRIPHSALA